MFQISFVFIQGDEGRGETKKKRSSPPSLKKKKLPQIFNNFLTFSTDVCYRKQIYTLKDEGGKMKKKALFLFV